MAMVRFVRPDAAFSTFVSAMIARVFRF